MRPHFRSFVRAAALLSIVAPVRALGVGFAGRVIDAQGKAVPNARVLAAESNVGRILFASVDGAFAISPSEDDPIVGTGGHLTGEARCDVDGKFTISGLRPARYSLMAIGGARGFALRFDVQAIEGSGDIELRVRPPVAIEGHFDGMTLDPTRHVIELKPNTTTANITLTPNVMWSPGDRFRFGPLPDVGDWSLVLTDWVQERAFRATLATLPIHCDAGQTTKIALDLARGDSLVGKVADAAGKPLSNVSVVARSKAAPVTERGALTDDRGQYTIRGLAPGTWTVEARRWTLRATAGCGVGPKDLFAAREVTLPLVDPALANLTVDQSLATLEVGDMAPEFVVKTQDGKTLALADLRGKIVLVDFWATWCGMCRAEFPRLRETYAQFGGGKELEIVGASIDQDVEAARRLTATLKLSWPQTALGPVETNALAQLFNIAATPSSFLIDRAGKIVAINVAGEELRAQLARSIAVAK